MCGCVPTKLCYKDRHQAELARGPPIANPWQENQYDLSHFIFLQKTFHVQSPNSYKQEQFQTIRVTPIL